MVYWDTLLVIPRRSRLLCRMNYRALCTEIQIRNFRHPASELFGLDRLFFSRDEISLLSRRDIDTTRTQIILTIQEVNIKSLLMPLLGDLSTAESFSKMSQGLRPNLILTKRMSRPSRCRFQFHMPNFHSYVVTFQNEKDKYPSTCEI